MYKLNNFSLPKAAALMGALLLCFAPIAKTQALTDPTRPEGHNSAVESEPKIYTLDSVLIGSQRKLAIINGQSVAEGEQMALGKVESISDDKVVIRGKKIHVLKLDNGLVKTLVAKSSLENK